MVEVLVIEARTKKELEEAIKQIVNNLEYENAPVRIQRGVFPNTQDIYNLLDE